MAWRSLISYFRKTLPPSYKIKPFSRKAHFFGIGFKALPADQIVSFLSAQALYITAIMPYIVLAVLFGRAVSLRGSVDGLIHMFKPQVMNVSIYTSTYLGPSFSHSLYPFPEIAEVAVSVASFCLFVMPSNIFTSSHQSKASDGSKHFPESSPRWGVLNTKCFLIDVYNCRLCSILSSTHYFLRATQIAKVTPSCCPGCDKRFLFSHALSAELLKVFSCVVRRAIATPHPRLKWVRKNPQNARNKACFCSVFQVSQSAGVVGGGFPSLLLLECWLWNSDRNVWLQSHSQQLSAGRHFDLPDRQHYFHLCSRGSVRYARF